MSLNGSLITIMASSISEYDECFQNLWYGNMEMNEAPNFGRFVGSHIPEITNEV